jgi:UDP-N-acetylglucosamine:LPS N-acetylglucosamine transferase
MKTFKLTYLATADARGHLMRAQLLTHALRTYGADVDVLTTSDEGVAFLAGFGIAARVLSRHYAVQFDNRQNMLSVETDANIASYIFRPSRMWRDIMKLRVLLRDADLIVNDSFHPALLFMGCMPGWRRKVVHVYGASLRHAVQNNFSGRLPGILSRLFHRIAGWQIDASLARIEHDFSYAATCDGTTFRLPTPVMVAEQLDAAVPRTQACAAVYLNPHFRDPRLAEGLETGLNCAAIQATLVGEGYAGRARWKTQDADWVRQAAASDLIVSAPGMAALSVALVYRRPIVLVLTEQPEQKINAARAAELGLAHRVVVWRGNAATFAQDLHSACGDLLRCTPTMPAPDGHAVASARLQSWAALLHELAARSVPSMKRSS